MLAQPNLTKICGLVISLCSDGLTAFSSGYKASSKEHNFGRTVLQLGLRFQRMGFRPVLSWYLSANQRFVGGHQLFFFNCAIDKTLVWAAHAHFAIGCTNAQLPKKVAKFFRRNTACAAHSVQFCTWTDGFQRMGD